jgi:hypothetical protein
MMFILSLCVLRASPQTTDVPSSGGVVASCVPKNRFWPFDVVHSLRKGRDGVRCGIPSYNAVYPTHSKHGFYIRFTVGLMVIWIGAEPETTGSASAVDRHRPWCHWCQSATIPSIGLKPPIYRSQRAHMIQNTVDGDGNPCLFSTLITPPYRQETCAPPPATGTFSLSVF